MNKKTKKTYEKPAIVFRKKTEVLAAVCDSNWVPSNTCMLDGQVGCKKTRF